MQLIDGMLLREIAGSWVVVPVGERVVQMNSILSLSESGALLWKGLEKGSDKAGLVDLLLNEYEVSESEAEHDVEDFLAILREKALLQ